MLRSVEFTFGNELTLPVEGFSVVGFFRDYDITPDGERLVMMFPANSSGDDEARPQINIVLNWFEELTRLVPTE